MARVPATPDNIRRAAEIIRQGGVVAFPTETVYGLGADALSERACARIFAVKGRPRFDPLIVHVAGLAEIDRISERLDERARLLAEVFWPGALTLVLPKAARVPDIVTAGLPTVAVRVPSHPVARALLAEAGRPIAAPSANPFGYLSPTLAEHVELRIGTQVDLILDGGPSDIGLESTIVDLSEPNVARLLRAGAIELERIEARIGPLERERTTSGAPRAPGQLDGHYAPETPLVVLDGPAGPSPAGSPAGLLAFGPPPPEVARTYAAVEILSPTRDLREAAARLFACLHRLDEARLATLFAEPVPAEGLGLAILDRLTRARGKGG